MEQRYDPQFWVCNNPIFFILCYMLFLFLDELGMEIHTCKYLRFFVLAS